MRAALTLCLAVLGAGAGLAGCAEGQDPFLTALEALDRSAPMVPGGRLVSVEGTEGPATTGHQPSPGDDAVVAVVESTAFEDDGLPDGLLGDGRLSSWVVGWRTDEQLVEVRVFGDGRPPVKAIQPLPEYLLDQSGALLMRDAVLDSEAAAAGALATAAFADGPSPEGGYRYSFSPYTRDLSTRPYLLGPAEMALESLGWSTRANSWSVTRFDPAWIGGVPQAAAIATVDAFSGNTEVASRSPVHRAQVLLADETFEPSIGDAQGVANLITFEVPEGARRMSGDLYAQSHTATQRGVTAPHLTLTRPDGDIVYEGPGQRGLELLEIEPTPAGTWTLEVSHDTELPSTVHVYAFLWAIVSPVA